MDDITKSVKSPESSGLLIDAATEAVKNDIKNQEGGFVETIIAPMATSLLPSIASFFIRTVPFSLINAITGKRVVVARKEQEGGFLPLLALLLMIKAISEKRITREERR